MATPRTVRAARGWLLGRRLLAAGGVGACLVAILWGVSQIRIETTVESFLPTNDPAVHAQHEKATNFGDEPIVVVLRGNEPGGLLSDTESVEELLHLEGRLAHLPDVAAVYGPATTLNQVAGAAQAMLVQMTGARDALHAEVIGRARESGADRQEIARLVRSALGEFDRRYGALLVKGLPAGLPTLRNEAFVRQVVYDADGQPRSQWDFVVPDENSVAILVRPRPGLDQQEVGDLTDRVEDAVGESFAGQQAATITGVPVLTSALTERAEEELPRLGAVAVVVVGLLYLLLPWSRRRVAGLRPVVAALIGTATTLGLLGWLGHSLSIGAVAFLPILLGIGSDFALYLSMQGEVRRPLAASGAAAAGFASLVLSPLAFVRELGTSVALGLVVTTLVALGLRKALGPVDNTTPKPTAANDPGSDAPGSQCREHRLGPRLVALVMAAAVGGAGLLSLAHMDLQAQPDRLASGLPELEDAETAREVLGSSAEVSIVLQGDDVTSPAALEWARLTERAIASAHRDEMRPIVTLPGLLGFLGPDPSAAEIRAGLELLPGYLSSTVLLPDRSEALLTYGIAMDDVQEQDALLRDVRSELPPAPDGYRVDVVGLPVAAANAVDAVGARGLMMNAAGLALAALVLGVALRGTRDVTRAVLAAVFATGAVVLFAAVLTGSLNPLTIAIGSLTVATACEFSVMVGRQPPARGRVTSVAVAATSGVGGYLVLCLSEIAILREFGLLLALSVATSFAAAHLMAWILPDATTSDGRPETELPVRRLKVGAA